jgi:putative ABC transport system substrate-binding protein
MISRAALAVALALGVFAVPPAATAQHKAERGHRIGLLYIGDPRPSAPLSPQYRAFMEGLRELGYVEGQNLVIERRIAAKAADLPELAAEMVRLNVEVIVATATPAIDAARRATNTIPIVMPVSFDAVTAGFVASLARPGGNITGLTLTATDVVGKRVELLKETIPRLTRIAIVLGPPVPVDQAFIREADTAAHRLGLKPQVLRIGAVDELENMFATLGKERVAAALVIEHPDFTASAERIAAWSTKHRVPTMLGGRQYVDAGGLMSYGANTVELFRRAATYVDKILKGVKPADLPVEQPTRYELVINLKTAKALGLTIPPSLLLRADEVFQ